MKLWCTTTMFKQKFSRHSGRENCCHDQKKHVRVALMWRWRWQFFYWQGILHYEFVPRGETVNKEFYLNVLKCLREAVRRQRPEAWTNNTWMLHHDNAPAHASLLIPEFLTKHETTVVHPAALLSRFGHCRLSLVPEVKIPTKRSPISDGRGDRRKFDNGPSHHPAKHVPGRVPELERKVQRSVSRVEGSTLKETSLIKS